MSKVAKNSKSIKKSDYKIINWKAYNQSLCRRGDLTIWVEEGLAEKWYYAGISQQGRPFTYSNDCIEFLLSLKVVFRLPYRQTKGFAESVFGLMGVDLPIPSYTQISRRSADLEVNIRVINPKGGIHLVMDSTGLKVYGEGEWKVRKHGIYKRRTWRKLHLALDEKTGMIHAETLTENDIDDASQVDPALDQIEAEIDKFSGDGAYDKKKVWDRLKKEGIEGVIPPQRNAIFWVDEEGVLKEHDRNKILLEINQYEDYEEGRKRWKENSNYHRRSLSETAMFRFKKIFGSELYSRKIETQQVEAQIKVAVLNRMTALGMSISVCVH